MKITSLIKYSTLSIALTTIAFADKTVYDDARDMAIKANIYLDENGRDVAFKTFNDKGEGFYNEKDDLYVFVLDSDAIILASGDKKDVGKDISDEKTIYDKTKGDRIGEINDSVQKQGWMSYTWKLMDSDTKAPKSSYLLVNEKTGLIVGVGAYDK